MNCKQFEALWEDWLAGRPAPALVDHLRDCEACRAVAEELQQSSAWLATLKQAPPEASPAFWVRLREALEAREQRAEFWAALARVAGRAAVTLAALVLLFTVFVLETPPQPAVAEFGAPPTYVDDPAAGLAAGNGRLNRDQVVLTLVAQREPQR